MADKTHPARAPVGLTFPCLATRVVLSWTLAGAVTGGGFFVAFITLSRQVSPHHMMPLGLLFFLVGALAGIVHGSLFAYVGRAPDRTRQQGIRSILLGVLYSAIGLVFVSVLAMWIALTSASLTTGKLLDLTAVVIAWGLGAVLCAWAMVDGWRALRNTLRRWPESRIGSATILSVFAVVLVVFLIQRPEIWFTDIRVTGLGAVILALVATLWLATPVVVVGLHFFHRWNAMRHRAPDPVNS